jgi:hypothetical protein
MVRQRFTPRRVDFSPRAKNLVCALDDSNKNSGPSAGSYHLGLFAWTKVHLTIEGMNPTESSAVRSEIAFSQFAATPRACDHRSASGIYYKLRKNATRSATSRGGNSFSN